MNPVVCNETIVIGVEMSASNRREGGAYYNPYAYNHNPNQTVHVVHVVHVGHDHPGKLT